MWTAAEWVEIIEALGRNLPLIIAAIAGLIWGGTKMHAGMKTRKANKEKQP